MAKREIEYAVSGYGKALKVLAKTPSAAVYRFRRFFGLLANGGFKYISVDPSLPKLHNVAKLLKPLAPKGA